ncbi:hypothetical protein [Lacticaseibacillus sp. GG6-2]
MKKVKGFIAFTVAILMAAPLAGCGSQSQTAMQGKVVAKTHRRAVSLNADDGSQYVAMAVHVSPHVSVHTTPHVSPHATTPHTSGTHVSTFKANAGHVGVSKVTKPVTPTMGKSAVKAVSRTHFINNRTFRRSPFAHTYFPFWYYAAFRARDHHERYLLTLKIGSKTRQISVSKRMYDKARVGDYVQINGSNFQVLRKTKN